MFALLIGFCPCQRAWCVRQTWIAVKSTITVSWHAHARCIHCTIQWCRAYSVATSLLASSVVIPVFTYVYLTLGYTILQDVWASILPVVFIVKGAWTPTIKYHRPFILLLCGLLLHLVFDTRLFTMDRSFGSTPVQRSIAYLGTSPWSCPP